MTNIRKFPNKPKTESQNGAEKTEKKLTQAELQELQQNFNTLNVAKQQIANLCYEYEIALRKLKTDFEKRFSKLELEIEDRTAESKKFMEKTKNKYGDGLAVDLQTGIIKPQ